MKFIFRSAISRFGRNRLGCMAFALLLAGCEYCEAQNTNVPNKPGPMGIQVNTRTGNTFIHRSDIYISARLLDFDISFSYNSYAFDQNIGYGNGWIFEYAMLYKTDSAGNITIKEGGGREDRYTKTGSQFTPPVGHFDTLSEYQPGKYLLRTKGGVKLYFDNSTHKRLTKITEPNGNFLNLGYTDTLVNTITNSSGQTITLNYTNGRLTSITDANTTPVQTYTYTYDAYGNLTKVTDPTGGSYKYTYLLNGPISSMTDKNSNVADIIYYSDYAAREIVSCNSRTAFSYDSATRTTTVIDFVPTGQNQVSTYIYNEKGWLARLIGSCCGFDMTFTYDNSGNLLERKDAKGNVYKYTYDNRGNYLTITDPQNNVASYTYTSDFNSITRIVDPLGNTYTGNYDAKGNLAQITKPGNLHETYSYDSNGDLLSFTDANNNSASVIYDAYGYPQKITLPLNVEVNVSFDARGNFTSCKDANGNIYSYQYDSLNRVVKIIDPLNHFHTLSYDKAGNISSYTDPKGFKQVFNYDASDRIVSYKDAKGTTRSYTYDAMHNLVSYSDALGKTTSFTYDKQNRIVSVTDAAGNGFSFNYDANGNVVSTTNPVGNTINYNYDELNRVVGGSDDTGPLGTITYDKNGNVTSFTNGSGVSVLYTYDNLNRLTRVTDPLGNSRVFTYDNEDNLLTTKDKNNHISSYTYNALNRVTSYADNNNNQVSVHYDSTGNATSVTDQNGNITGYLYDPLNRLVKTVYPDGSTIQFIYDNNNNVISKKLTDETSILYTYDSLNRMIAKDLPGGEHFSYTYDSKNRVLTATNAAGELGFTYDDIDRLTSETFNSHSTSYTYDIAAKKTSITYPDGTVVTRSYDNRARLIGLSVNNQSITSYQYNNINQVTKKDYSNEVSTIYQYDAANRLSAISTNKNNIPSLSFQYDNEMNRTVIERSNMPQASETFSYDAGNRLTGYKMGTLSGNTIPSPAIQNTYSYDGVGNRISANLNGLNTTYTKNNLNQLISLNNTSQNIIFTYDGNGNQLYDGSFYMRYDPLGRKLVDSSATNIYRYQYDAIGRRIQKTINGVLLKYYYAGLQQIEERNGSDSLLAQQVFVNPFMPLIRKAGNQKYFYHQNHLGSTEAITDSTGSLKEWYKYEDFGKPYIYDPSNNSLAGSLIGNTILFTGQKYDAHNGSYASHYRNYNPATGTFIQRDPIGYADQMGMYQYVGNNPGNYVDPMGLNKEGPPCPGEGHEEVSELEELFELFHHSSHAAELGNESRLEALYTQWKNLVNNKIDAETFYNISVKYTKAGNINGGVRFLKLAENALANNTPINKALQGLNSTLGKFEGAGKVLGFLGSAANGIDIASKGWNVGTAIREHGVFSSNTGEAGLKLGGAFTNLNPAAAAFNVSDFGVGQVLSHLTGEKVHTLSGFQANTIAKGYNVGAQKSEVDLFEFYKSKDEQGIPAHMDIIENGQTKRVETTWLHIYFMNQDKRNKLDEGKPNPCPPNENNHGDQNNHHGNHDGEHGSAEVDITKDPNIIIGPDGIGNNKWISINDRLPYTILFTNDTIATAPVKIAKITYPIDPKQDAAFFQLGDFGFNNMTFSVPQNANNYYQRLDLRDSLGIYVDITAGLDGVNHEAFWIFESIDPTTLLPTADPLKGFLLTHDDNDPAAGNGFVSLTIKPVTNANTGDTMSTYAYIIFDSNDTIPTNRVWNTIDALPPVSSIADLPDYTNDTRIPLHYSGADDPGGSGVKWYSIYISDNNGTPGLYISNFRGADTSFRGVADHVYKFYIAATDSTGNIETIKYVDSVRITTGEMVLCSGGGTTLDSRVTGATYQWQLDTGSGFTDISNGGVYSNTDSSVLHISNAPSSMYGYQYRCKVNGSSFSQVFLLKFENKWEGTISNAWENPANWSCGSLPDANTDVIINSGKANYPQVNSNVSIRTLTTYPGSSININTGYLLNILK